MSEYKLGSDSVMNVEEIKISFKQAKDKKAQIGILADLCDTTKDEILRILRDAGYVDKNGKAVPSAFIRDEDMPDIARMRKNGLPFTAIAKKYGVSDQTVSNRLKAWEKEKEVTVPADFVHSSEVTSMAKEVPAKSIKELNRVRIMESLDIDKDFYRAVLEVYDLLRYVAVMYPGVRMICEVSADGAVMASGDFADLVAEYRGGGPANGKPDEEQG